MKRLFADYDAADEAAIKLIDTGVTVVFVGLDLPTGKWGIFTNHDALATPIKRYRRIYSYLNYDMSKKPCIEVREVINWRRN